MAGDIPIASLTSKGLMSSLDYGRTIQLIDVTGASISDDFIHVCKIGKFGLMILDVVYGDFTGDIDTVQRLYICNRSQTGLYVKKLPVSGFSTSLKMYARLNDDFSIDIFVKRFNAMYNKLVVQTRYNTQVYNSYLVGVVDNSVSLDDLTEI